MNLLMFMKNVSTYEYNLLMFMGILSVVVIVPHCGPYESIGF